MLIPSFVNRGTCYLSRKLIGLSDDLSDVFHGGIEGVPCLKGLPLSVWLKDGDVVEERIGGGKAL